MDPDGDGPPGPAHHWPPPWEHHGPWNGPGFDPLGPMLAGLVTVLVVLSMMWWTYRMLGAPRLPAPRPRDDLRQRWRAALDRHATVAAAYARYECDPVAVLRLPGLADVRQESTARFVDAFAEASALGTEDYPGPEFARRLLAAVEREERAWSAATAAAERLRDARFAPADRALLDQARTLLDVIDASEHEPERRTALHTALRRLRELERRTGWRLPPPAVVAAEHRARGVLTA